MYQCVLLPSTQTPTQTNPTNHGLRAPGHTGPSLPTVTHAELLQ